MPPTGRKRHRVDASSLSSGKRRATPANELGWRSVEVIGKLTDAEGFYGLEEVNDVEVIRADDGQVQFVRFRVLSIRDVNFADTVVQAFTQWGSTCL
jgi:hypothetical protein